MPRGPCCVFNAPHMCRVQGCTIAGCGMVAGLKSGPGCKFKSKQIALCLQKPRVCPAYTLVSLVVSRTAGSCFCCTAWHFTSVSLGCLRRGTTAARHCGSFLICRSYHWQAASDSEIVAAVRWRLAKQHAYCCKSFKMAAWHNVCNAC